MGREAEIAHRLRRYYGLTVDEFRAKEVAQQHRCAICGDEVKLVQDHDHGTRMLRDLLCGPCNKGIGHLRDDPARLRSAALYLDRHRLEPSGRLAIPTRIGPRRGEAHGRSKLTDVQVRRIAERLADGEVGERLATEYGVGRSTISKIRHGRRLTND